MKGCVAVLLTALLAACNGTGTMPSGTDLDAGSLGASATTPTSSAGTPEPSGTGELIITEAAPRGPDAGCTTQGEFEVRLITAWIDGNATLSGELVDPTKFPEFAEGFPPIVWPLGFSADLGPPAVVSDEAGEVVAMENDVITLAGGSIDDVGYHVCIVNGVEYLN